MPKSSSRLSLFMPLVLTLLLAACAASGPKPAASKPAAKAPAAAPKPAPAPAPQPERPTSSLIVMGAPLPGVPMPVAAKPGQAAPPPPGVSQPEPKPFTPQPGTSQPGADPSGQLGAGGLPRQSVPPLTGPTGFGEPAPKPFTPSPAPGQSLPPVAPDAAGSVPAPFTSGPGAVPDNLTAAPAATAAADFSMTPAPTTPVATAPQGTPTGYGGIAWGTSAKQAPGLVMHEADPSVSVITYIWPSGPQDIVGAPVKDAFLEFYQDRFYHVWIDLTGRQAYETALAGLTAAYGPPTSQNLEKNYHAWTLGDVNVYCAFHATENEGDVSFFYQPLYERLAAARKAAPAKGHGARRAKP